MTVDRRSDEMLELPMYLDVLITLPEVLFLMALSALFGLIVDGVIKFIRGGPSDGEGTQRRRRKRWCRNHPSSSLDISEWTILVDGSNFAQRGDGTTDVSLSNLVVSAAY